MLATSTVAMAQTYKGRVGVNTETPKSTLDVTGVPADATVVDGVLVTRLTGDQLTAKNAIYAADQDGVVVFVTAPVAAATTGKTEKVLNRGFYYYSDTTANSTGTGLWVPIKSGDTDNEFFVPDVDKDGKKVIRYRLTAADSNFGRAFLVNSKDISRDPAQDPNEQSKFMFIPEKRGAARVGTVQGDGFELTLGGIPTHTGFDFANIGRSSFTSGYNNVAKTDNSVAMGTNNVVSGLATTGIAIGSSNLVTGSQGFAAGYYSEASAASATALGVGTRATGIGSLALGSANKTAGGVTIKTTASGLNSVAIAGGTSAGEESLSFATNSQALATNSIAMGVETRATAGYGMVVGSHNAFDTAVQGNAPTSAFVVGTGLADTQRRNALMVQKNGRVALGGWDGTTYTPIIANQTLDVYGTARIADLPVSGSGTIYDTSTTGEGLKATTFTGVNTVVADANGNLGKLAGTPITSPNGSGIVFNIVKYRIDSGNADWLEFYNTKISSIDWQMVIVSSVLRQGDVNTPSTWGPASYLHKSNTSNTVHGVETVLAEPNAANEWEIKADYTDASVSDTTKKYFWEIDVMVFRKQFATSQVVNSGTIGTGDGVSGSATASPILK